MPWHTIPYWTSRFDFNGINFIRKPLSSRSFAKSEYFPVLSKLFASILSSMTVPSTLQKKKTTTMREQHHVVHLPCCDCCTSFVIRSLHFPLSLLDYKPCSNRWAGLWSFCEVAPTYGMTSLNWTSHFLKCQFWNWLIDLLLCFKLPFCS